MHAELSAFFKLKSLPSMLLLLNTVKTLIELSILFLLGRSVLGFLAGARRHGNVFWQVLDVAARPVLWLTRRISPPLVLDRHIPLAALSLLLLAWLLVTLFKIRLCLSWGVAACR